MRVADIRVTISSGLVAAQTNHVVHYADAAFARSEYERVVDLLNRREQRKNDLPPTIELDGGATGSRLSVPTDDVRAVQLADFALQNEQEAGVADAFPHLFKRR